VLGPRGASCTKAPRGPSAMPLGLASNEGLGRTLGRSLKLQPDDARDNQSDAADAGKAGWLLE
jgi:hypothetical protein